MILVIGCGYVGERTADLLHEEGREVVGVTHSEESARRLAALKQYAVHAGDVGDESSVRALALKLGKAPSAIIHCASSNRGGAEAYRKVYLDGCRHLTTVFPGAQLVFTSSTSVYPQTDGSWVTEESDATPERETSRLLREAEGVVLAQHGAVARLAGIYGPERSFVLKNFLEGKAAIEGDGGGRWLNQIHRDDAAAALVHIVNHHHHGVFNVSDGTPLTQRECLEKLALRFDRPLPPVAPPNLERKRAFTSKRVSNAKLRATDWMPRYASWFDALEQDTALVPSIIAQITQRMNVVIVGLMGSGKSAVGRLVAQSLGFDFVDTDQLVVEAAGRSIPEIFAAENEAGFRKRETDALRTLVGRQRCVIATGGGIVTQPENLPLLKDLGFIAWLNASPETLHRRTSHSNDRPLLRDGDPLAKLRSLLEARAPLYEKVSDLKITTDELSLQDSAYGLAESARVFFSSRA